MRLLKVQTVDNAKIKLRAEFEKLLKIEEKHIMESFNYCLADDIKSSVCVPAFNKSRVDGYAVKFSDCKIASDSSPCILNLVGVLNIGDENTTILNDNECMYIPTGGMLPPNADAMIMIEHTQKLSDDIIVINAPATLNQNITLVGDDVKVDSIVAKKGNIVDERMLAVLVSLNIEKIPVFKPLSVFILSTGDELVEYKNDIKLGQTFEINSIFLSNLLEKNNFNVIGSKLIKDDKLLYENTIDEITKTYSPDIVLTSGGSSKGDKDYTIDVFEKLTNNVFCEGIGLKPGKPTILASTKDRLFLGMPGHPVSSYMVMQYVILNSYFETIGIEKTKTFGQISHNVSNSGGRENIMLCNINNVDKKMIIEPIYYNSTNIGVLSEADGYFIIGENSEGLKKNEEVEVFLF